MRKLWYFPLEPYKERYTVQLSAKGTGWLERNWIKEGVVYERIEGKAITDDKHIAVGEVLDACGRGYWSTSQIGEFLIRLNEGDVSKDDCLYFDDFWHPGISALPYAFHLTKIKPKMFAMLHAQSIDPHDFTHPMKHWMRYWEVGLGKVLDGIFVTSTCLRDMCLYNGIGRPETVHICGLPYNSEEVRERFPETNLPDRKKQVIFTSRWDREKCPNFFLEVMEYILTEYHRGDIHFLHTTSADTVRSNEPELLTSLHKAERKFENNFKVKVGLSKEEYYWNLLESRVQFNCADQDFVSWTLLEATTCGCIPVYPYYLSFPEALDYQHEFMYVKGDVRDAARKIVYHINEPLSMGVAWIYQRFDDSWLRMLRVMQGKDSYPEFLRSKHDKPKDTR